MEFFKYLITLWGSDRFLHVCVSSDFDNDTQPSNITEDNSTAIYSVCGGENIPKMKCRITESSQLPSISISGVYKFFAWQVLGWFAVAFYYLGIYKIND